MQIFWRNDALCLRPDTDKERAALAAIALKDAHPPEPLEVNPDSEQVSGEQVSEVLRIEH
jgi:hypothetical protein